MPHYDHLPHTYPFKTSLVYIVYVCSYHLCDHGYKTFLLNSVLVPGTCSWSKHFKLIFFASEATLTCKSDFGSPLCCRQMSSGASQGKVECTFICYLFQPQWLLSEHSHLSECFFFFLSVKLGKKSSMSWWPELGGGGNTSILQKIVDC